MPLPLCVRVDADDANSAQSLANDGWRQIEVLETWRQSRRRAWRVMKNYPVRAADKGDIPWIAELAASSFTHDRMHRDTTVPRDLADAAKRAWVEQTELPIWVPENGDLAFLILRRGIIDLLCVHKDQRWQGIGGKLIKAVMGKLLPHGLLQAGTQDTNTAAQRLYASLGMAVVRRQTSWHKP